MNIPALRMIMKAVMMAVPLTLTAGLAFADGSGAASPHLDAKREMVRKQQDQRITPDKRKAAAEALKAERLKVHKAKQAVKHSRPPLHDNKQP